MVNLVPLVKYLPGPIQKRINKKAINDKSYLVPARPRPLSMAADYVTWQGLTDRKFSGRHLPANREYNDQLPDLDIVKDLFRRSEDVRSKGSTLLFPIFAQWLTDSVLRTKFNTEGPQDYKQNESNHEIDLCQIYGISEVQTNILRSMSRGRLKSQTIDGQEYPEFLFETVNVPSLSTMTLTSVQIKLEFKGLYTEGNMERVFGTASDEHKLNCFAVGLEHGNSTMGNTLMNTIWLREHNRIAGIISAAHPDWDDERMFQTARCVNVVLLLKVTVEDYMSHISGGFPLKMDTAFPEGERWYRRNHIAAELSLLYRFHDLIPETVEFNGETRASSALRRNNKWLMEIGIDQACLDASKQACGKMMLGNTPDFLLEVRKMSLIQSRVSGLTTYNDYREHYGMKKKTSFKDLVGENNTPLAQKMQYVYGDIDNVEWFVGIWAEDYDEETHVMGGLVGNMVANDAFTQILTNPLLSKQVFNKDTFTKEGFAIIKKTSKISDIIGRNSGIKNGAGVTLNFKASRRTKA